jgi:hypothetical protein
MSGAAAPGVSVGSSPEMGKGSSSAATDVRQASPEERP